LLILNYLNGMKVISRYLILLRQSPNAHAALLLLRLLPILLAVTIAVIYSLYPTWISKRWPSIAVAFILAVNIQFFILAMISSQRQLGRLQSLNLIGQALSANLSLDQLLETIYMQVRALRDIPTFYVALLDQEHDRLTFPYVIENHQSAIWDDCSLGNGLVEYVMRTRQPLLLMDRAHTAEFEGTKPDMMCYLGVPLIADDEVIGVMAILHNKYERAYTKADSALFTTIAAQAAIAIRNARLFQATEAVTAALYKLVETSRQFTASLDLPEVAQTIVQQFASATAAQHVSLYQYAESGYRVLAHMPELSAQLADQLLVQQNDILNHTAIVQQNNSILVEGLGRDYHLLALPLVAHEQTIGLVILWELDQEPPRLVSNRLVEGMLPQAAIALQNAIAHNITDMSLQDQVIQLSTIEVISRQMSATLDLDHIINDLLAAAISAIDAAVGSCALVVNPDTFALISRLDAQGIVLGAPMTGNIHQGVVGRVVQTQLPALVPDTLADPDYVSIIPDMRSELCVPILRENQVIGILNFEDPRLDAFDESDQRLITMLAEHAAIAIENAWLFNDRRRQIETLVSLRTLSLQLLSATNLTTVAQAAVERAQEITHADNIRFYLWHERQAKLVLAASLGKDDAKPCEVLQQIIDTGKPYYSVDLQTLPLYRVFALPYEFEAQVYLPVLRAEQFLGMLDIQFDNSRYYTQNEIQALDVLANQTAVAIENTRLYEEVRAGRDQLQAILDSSREAMLMFDRRGRLLRANSAAEKLFGCSISSYLGSSFWHWLEEAGDLQNRAGYTEQQMRQYAQDVMRNPNTITRRQFEQKLGENPRYIDETGLPVTDQNGEPAGWLLVWRDATEEHYLASMREELNNMIIHDLRSPLTAIISSLNMLQDITILQTEDVDVTPEVIEVAQNSAQSMLSLVQSLLDVAKLEQNAAFLECDSFSLPETVDSACATVLGLAMGAEIEIQIDVAEDFPYLWIDHEKIRRVLINLLDNALRHTPFGGKITISAELTDAQDWAVVRVTDTGPGIPIEVRSRIFDKFAQTEHKALRGHQGTGLGLTFCKLAVEAHGGQIWVEDGPNGGAAFCFTLPVAAPNHRNL
jgi:PAS domain S-box-containing protein